MHPFPGRLPGRPASGAVLGCAPGRL